MAEPATTETRIRELDGVSVPVAGTWAIDPAHTTASFVARHLMVTKVRGRFERLSGQITVGERPEDSSVEVELEAASITTDTQQRDDHLRSPDFLDVERFPKLRFRSTKVEQTGPTSLRVIGDLTIRDVTRPVVLDVDYHGAQTAPWGATVVGFSARTEIDREDWGITWNQVLETGGVVVSKKVVIEIEIEASPAQVQGSAA